MQRIDTVLQHSRRWKRHTRRTLCRFNDYSRRRFPVAWQKLVILPLPGNTWLVLEQRLSEMPPLPGKLALLVVLLLLLAVIHEITVRQQPLSVCISRWNKAREQRRTWTTWSPFPSDRWWSSVGCDWRQNFERSLAYGAIKFSLRGCIIGETSEFRKGLRELE